MEDSSSACNQQMKPQLSEQNEEKLKCPRCDSTNTKFCYYNNYNLSQPRHFCKNCRRYWTKGGALRNIPVGGGSRKKNTKRNSNHPKRSSSTSSSSATEASGGGGGGGGGYGLSSSAAFDQDRRMLDITGSFSSLLASNGQFGNLMMMNQHAYGQRNYEFGETPPDSNSSGVGNPPQVEEVRTQSTNINVNSESFLGVQSGAAGDSSCWGGGNGWPDLAIFTPGSTFQN